MQPDIFQPRASANVLVVGDIILDQYIHGQTHRISPEAPVPIVKVDSTEERPGGAANVAVNVAALGVGITLLGTTGNDEAAERLGLLLQKQGVSCQFIKDDNIHTISKLRVLSQHQQLLRIDYEKDNQSLWCKQLSTRFEQVINNVDIVILSDYAKGSLKKIAELINIANRHNVSVLVDPKSSDFSIYKNASIITPNLKEFEEVAGTVESTEDIVNKGKAMVANLNLNALLVTCGKDGMILLPRDGEAFHLQAEAHEVYDVTGAGDTVIATLAAALACKYDLKKATILANIAAGMVVEKLGATAVRIEELNSHRCPVKRNIGILEQDAAVQEIQSAKLKGERVVVTNGCFDIIHAGHISYLEKAKALGDKLVVAVNSDDSVKKLKGPSRPFNSLQSRMKVLAALSCVDIVVSFVEQTPEELYKRLVPDILVKGGDYKEEQIAGAAFVKEHGGEVVILPFSECHSTSLIADKIKKHCVDRE